MKYKTFFWLIIGMFLLASDVQGLVAKQVQEELARNFDSYRSAYKDFEIKKNTYTANPSISNQNNYLESIKKVMYDRSKTLQLYWRIIASELTAQETNTDWVNTNITNLNADQEKISSIKTQAEALNYEAGFGLLAENFNSQAYGAITNIKSNKLNKALKQLSEFKDHLIVNTTVQITDENNKQQRLRGLNEVGNLLVTAASMSAMSKIDQDMLKSNPSQSFSDWQLKNAQAYDLTLRALSLLKELAKGLAY